MLHPQQMYLSNAGCNGNRSGIFSNEWLSNSHLTLSSIYFVERSRIRETTVPNLVNNLSRLRLVFAVGPTSDR